jgi:hypothetical protein
MIEIDFSFIDNFMMGNDFMIEHIPRINFSERNDNINVVRFILNEEILRFNDEEARWISREVQRFDQEISNGILSINIEANVKSI